MIFFYLCVFKIQNVQVIQMMSSNVALLHSNNSCLVDLLEPAICEDLDLHIANILVLWMELKVKGSFTLSVQCQCCNFASDICLRVFTCFP